MNGAYLHQEGEFSHQKEGHDEGVGNVHTNWENIISQEQKVSNRNACKSKIGDKSANSINELVLTIENLVYTKKRSLDTFFSGIGTSVRSIKSSFPVCYEKSKI